MNSIKTFSNNKMVVCVIGVGPLVGEQIAQSFALAGYRVALLSRSVDKLSGLVQKLGGDSKAFYCDVTKPDTIRKAFDRVREHYHVDEPDTVIYNVRDWHFASFDSVQVQDFVRCWELATLGLFHVAKQVLPGMERRGRGNLGITGATANWRGIPDTCAFAPAKAAQRSLAQSLARDKGPKGIHVYLVVVDGVISEGGGRSVSPSAIGDTHVMLAQQPRSAWTFELNLTAGPGHDKLVTL